MEKLIDIARMFAFGVRDYAFWLIVISVFCFALERFFPWRKEQRVFRRGFFQDVVWLALNGHIFGVLIWVGGTKLWAALGVTEVFGRIEAVRLLQGAPVWLQACVLIVGKDFIDWNVHRLLHRVPFLWEFHKVHHSIEELDWVGNFRFHWMETLVYKFIEYLPLAVLGLSGEAWMAMALVTTLIGHLNHSNLPFSYGPLRYVINSPRFHIWHHDAILRGSYGKNFAVVFSLWDWLFGTAELPEGQPKSLGFEGLEQFPKGFWARLTYPLSRLFARTPSATPSAGGS